MKKPEGNAEGLTFMLTTSEVAKRLQVSPSTLSRWRATGIGPKVYWISQGSPRYREDDVMAWLEDCRCDRPQDPQRPLAGPGQGRPHPGRLAHVRHPT